MARRLDAISWGLFFVWVGIALLADVPWGIGLLGVGVILLGEQLARRYFGMPIEGFWLVVGILFLVGGVWELWRIQLELVPILFIIAGGALLVSAAIVPMERPAGGGVRGLMVCLALLASAASPAFAKAPADTLASGLLLGRLVIGEHVRASFVEDRENRTVTQVAGGFADLGPGMLWIEIFSGDEITVHQIATDNLVRLEIGRERARTGTGALIGALAGIGLGAVAGGDAAGAALGGGVGLGIGALAGSLTRVIEWREVLR